MSETINIDNYLDKHLQQKIERERALALMPETAVQLHEDVSQLSGILVRMGQMMSLMQQRLTELEERQRQVTLDHEEVRLLMSLIRLRADEFCEKYALADAGSVRAVRAAIKKDILKRYGVKDLHDVPAIARLAVQAQINKWTSIRLAMDLRARAGGGG